MAGWFWEWWSQGPSCPIASERKVIKYKSGLDLHTANVTEVILQVNVCCFSVPLYLNQRQYFVRFAKNIHFHYSLSTIF